MSGRFPGICLALAFILGGGYAWSQTSGPVAAPGIGTYGPPFATQNGHIAFGGATPSVSACGTGAAVAGTDPSSTVTTGTGTSGLCTFTPGNLYGKRPTCSVDGESATPPAFTIATNGVITFTSGVQDNTRYYIQCSAQLGGF